jgi:hypothetical protein
MMSSKPRGTTPAKTEVSHISAYGIGVLCRDRASESDCPTPTALQRIFHVVFGGF